MKDEEQTWKGKRHGNFPKAAFAACMQTSGREEMHTSGSQRAEKAWEERHSLLFIPCHISIALACT